eukprot:CAMPEP_0197432800 /NCGR_PEP_ID=MMETSP1175-20131217/799_1 /TAXON_ID=1003142 /ORGANISM="Triceratium dubium, Strain CCMP147" /LENGTH=44 /DNA_ID= /DNA_START= /DNA_END= /DNA_ORIENTATION=
MTTTTIAVATITTSNTVNTTTTRTDRTTSPDGSNTAPTPTRDYS